jgi:hypothetical protein
VIGPEGRLDELAAAVAAVLPDVRVGESGRVVDAGAAGGGAAGAGAGAVRGVDPDLEQPVVVLTVRQAKGLEFDSVLVADPGMILAESPRGLGDLYVALTRATQRAGVVYTGDLPPVLSRLTEVRSVTEAAETAGVSDVAGLAGDGGDRVGAADAEVA